ncbi:MAG: hypothetical protein CML66_02560 [Rhodobacteraceae bacterium]|nr:hypothetical protein [Paracoccaceae bacterium]MAY48156.1 hypothetical protein [Paracoccaceae bacterium]
MYKVTIVGLTALTLTATPVLAQDSDEDSGGRLVRFLENTLSGDGRTIRVVGLEGALSSRATIQRLEVSDDDGVWFVLENAVLDWNRLALIRGRFSVNELSAERIDFIRPPGTTTPAKTEVATPEVTPFQVPELPVAIQIGKLSVNEIDIGEQVVGTAAELSLDGNLSLADGALDALLDLERIDRQGDRILIDTSFDNSSRQLDLDIEANEGPGGLIGTLAKLPGAPSVDLDVNGSGPVEDFAATLSLSTDNQLRFGGDITLQGLSPEAGQDGSAQQVPLRFAANLGGDIRPLLPEQFHEFFGADTRIQTNGQRDPDGAISVETVRVSSQALSLDGSLDIDAQGDVDVVLLQAAVRPETGETVTLPVPGQVTTVELVRLTAGYDAAQGRDWNVNARVKGLASSEFAMDNLALTGSGQVGASDNDDMLVGRLNADISGLAMTDPALAKAAGEELTLDGGFRLINAGELILEGMNFNGAGLDATVDATLDGLDSGLRVDTTVQASVADISRFADLAGKPLEGSLDASLQGHVVPLSGGFDIQLDGTGQDLAVGIDQVDPLLEGRTDLTVDAARDETGLTLRSFTVNGTAITANANGVVRSEGTQLTFDAEVDDLGRAIPELPGPGKLSGDVHEEGDALVGKVSLSAPRGISLTADGRYVDGASQAHVDGSLDDLGIFVPQMPGAAQIVADVEQSGEDFTGTLRLLTEEGSEVKADGIYGPGKTNATFEAILKDLGIFVPQLPGQATVTGEAKDNGDGGIDGTVKAQIADGSTINAQGTYAPGSISATFDGFLNDLGTFVPQMPGRASVSGEVAQDGESYQGKVQARAADGSLLDAEGVYGPGRTAGTFKADLKKLEAFVPQMPGEATASGDVRQEGDAYIGSVQANHSDGSTLQAQGTYGPGQTKGDFSAALTNLGVFVPQMPGSATVTGTVEERDNAYRGKVDAKTADGSTLTAQGAYGDAEKNVTFDALLANVGRFVQPASGTAHLQGTAREDNGSYVGDVTVDGTAGIALKANGTIDPDGDSQIAYDATIDRVERFVPDFPGQLVSTGTASGSGDVWTIDSRSSGPAGVQATVAGTYNQATGNADITAQGRALLAAANAFIAPMAVSGPVQFDLRLNGAPGLSALSGNIDLPGARVAIPQVFGQIDPLSGRISMNSGSAQIDLNGNWVDGGSFTVNGPVSLTAPYTAGLKVAINNLVMTDGALYHTSLGGNVSIDGPLVGAGRISGVINVGPTELNIAASAGAAGGSPIPPITHEGESRGSFDTRERAGLIRDDSDSNGGGSSGPGYALDVTISAPQQIFVRGRGLDAELGGGLSLRGTTSNIVPAGQIDLIRGRLDIVGRRLELTRGSVTLEGSFDPYIDFAATNTSSAGTATIEIYGPLQSPQVDVTSSPARPPEEALGLLIFGDQFTNLSPLKLAQLASSLATLTGQTGQNGGLLGRARSDLGAASLDLTTDDEGNAQVGVGAYLSEQIYSDVTVNTEGRTELNLNLDVTNRITAKGKVDSEGNSSVGLFFSKDF